MGSSRLNQEYNAADNTGQKAHYPKDYREQALPFGVRPDVDRR